MSNAYSTVTREGDKVTTTTGTLTSFVSHPSVPDRKDLDFIDVYFLRLQKPDSDILTLGVHFTSMNLDVRNNGVRIGAPIELSKCKLVLTLDHQKDEEIKLNPIGFDNKNVVNTERGAVTVEQEMYKIDQDLLKRLCEAFTCDIRLSGRSYESANIYDGRLVTLAKAFYNECFDADAYKADIDQAAERDSGNSSSPMKVDTTRQVLDHISQTLQVMKKSEKEVSGCYVATAVYGSYDCPEVWTLRRFRDNILAETWYGRLFIKTYYAISPTLVKWFGETNWFLSMWRKPLDRLVANLQNNGVENTPYQDKY